MAIATAELGRREQPRSLRSTLEKGQRIALESNAGSHPVFIHDPMGLIKEGTQGVVVWKPSSARRS